MTTEILSITEILSSDSQKETLHNRALRELEAQLVHVKDKDLATPPGSPAEGDVYIVAASPTGAWAGHVGDIAHFYGGSWKFHVKREGLVLWIDDEDLLYAYNGSAWGTLFGAGSIFPVVDTTAILKGSSDATKLLKFEVDGLTTATTRTVTVQDKDGVISLAGKPRVSSVAYAASVTLDCLTADVFKITLTGNITIGFSNGVDTQKTEVILTQDATGGRTVAWDSGVTFGSDITLAIAVASIGANKMDRFGVEYASAVSKYHMIAVAKGY